MALYTNHPVDAASIARGRTHSCGTVMCLIVLLLIIVLGCGGVLLSGSL